MMSRRGHARSWQGDLKRLRTLLVLIRLQSSRTCRWCGGRVADGGGGRLERIGAYSRTKVLPVALMMNVAAYVEVL